MRAMTFARALDFLYPPACHLCQAPLTHGRYLCESCRDALPRLTAPFCGQCGLPADGAVPDSFTCPNCRGRSFNFDFARAALQARDGARELVHAFKYQRRIHLDRDLGTLAAEVLDDPRISGRSDWVLVPVPLHWKRRQWRWFNQAHEIARAIARSRSLPLVPALHRSRATPQQILLTRKQRLENLKNAFRLTRHERKHRQLKGKPVLLVDDVFTTGSTAHECAGVLKDQAEAEIVVVLTALRG